MSSEEPTEARTARGGRGSDVESSDEEMVLDALGNLGDAVENQQEVLDDLQGNLGALVDRVTDLESTAWPSQKPAPWTWRYLTGNERTTLWNQVGEFVDWLNTRFYGLLMNDRPPVAPCWYRHPIVVEELTALMVAWKAAYVGRRSPTVDPINWLHLHLQPTLDRVNERKQWALGNCGYTGHREVSEPQPVGDADKLRQHIQEDVATHPSPQSEVTD